MSTNKEFCTLKTKYKNPEERGAGSSSKDDSTIVVKNITFDAKVDEIEGLFRVFGKLKNLCVPKNEQGVHYGFCLVDYVNKDDAKVILIFITGF